MQMKRVNFNLLTFLGFFCCYTLLWAEATSAASTLFVFKPDGTIHCDKSPGMTLDRIGQELSSAGIKVFSSRKGYDGREGIALCGTPTGQINVYEIASSDVFEALRLGFKQLPENSIRKDK
jgi:hypothetical protein